MKNHLFIGLGGQGGKSIAELRKVFDQRADDAKSLSDQKIKWDFLYIDSSRDVSNSRENWTHFGKSLKLNPDSFVYLKDGGDSMNPASLSLRPDIQPWIGSTSVLEGFVEGVQGIQGANQRRRFGRLLYANNANRIRKAICDDKIAAMLSNGNQCAIHIFASLAGGTGSGSVVDLVTMLRTKYPSASVDDGFPIFLYLYATGDDFEEAQVGYFHQNQYAALRDLNALACGRLKPHMLGSDRGGEPFSGDEPITQILLSTSLNDRNQQITLQKQHKIVAEAAFERIFAYCSGNLNEVQQKPLTGEDRLPSYPGEPLGNLLRSFRFGSLGMRRWEVPTEEVMELLANELYVSCFRRILYRNWDSKLGFRAEKMPRAQSGSASLIQTLISRLEDRLTQKNQLTELSEAMINDLAKAHEGICNIGFKDLDLEGYQMSLKERYNNALYGSGVNSFFESLADKRKDRLNELLESIKSNILEAWTKADRPLGLSYVSDVLSELQELVRKWLATWGTSQEEVSDQALRVRMDARIFEWSKLTALSVPFRRQALALAQKADLISLLKSDLKKRAIEEDRQLLDLLITALGNLDSSYRQATLKLEEWEEKFCGKRDSLRRDISSRNQDSSNRYEISDETLDCYLRAQRLEELALNIAADALLKNTIKRRIEQRGIEALGRISSQDEIEYWQEADEEIYDRARQLHGLITDRDAIPPVLSGDLMGKLRERYLNNPDGFQAELQSFIESATCSAKIDYSQIQPKDLRGDPNMPSMPRKALVVGLPRGHAFANELKSKIKDVIPAGDNTAHGFYEHDDPSQIRLLSVMSFMAARFTRVVKELEEKYTQALCSNIGNDTAYFTNIDTSGERNQRPDLLLPSPEETRSAMRAALWTGARIKLDDEAGFLIQTSNDRVVMLRKGEEGLEPMLLGESIISVEQSADIRTIYRVVDEVSSVVAVQSLQQIEALQHEVAAVDREMRDKLGPASSNYAAWVKDRKKINEMLNR
jgi:hypothetical protein